MPNRPLIIGVESFDYDAYPVQYFSDYNFSERKVIFWDPICIIEELQQKGFSIAHRLGQSEQQEAARILNSRHEDMLSFLRHGGDLFVVLRDIPKVNFDAGNYTVLNIAKIKKVSGSILEAKGSGDLLDCLENLNKNLYYTAVSRSDEVTPLLTVPNSGDVVGSFLRHAWGGYIIFLPPTDDFGNNTADALDASNNLLTHAFRLPQILRDNHGEKLDLPSWAEGFQFESEQQSRQRIDELNSNISQANDEIETEYQAIETVEGQKQLFTGTDDLLEEAVLDALTKMGIQAVEGVEKEVDILACIGQTIIAIEVKGVKGTCKRAYVNQCKLWVTHCEGAMQNEPSTFDASTKAYSEKLKQLSVPVPNTDEDLPCNWDIKGLLVVNVFREQLLTDREDNNQLAFDANITKAIEDNKFCGITGLQLLGMQIACEENSDEGARISQSLIDTVGIHLEFTDWRDILVQSATEELDNEAATA